MEFRWTDAALGLQHGCMMIRRAVFAASIAAAAVAGTPASAESFVLARPPLDRATIAAVLRAGEPLNERGFAFEEAHATGILQRMAAIPDPAQRARAFTQAVIQTKAPWREWTVSSAHDSAAACERQRDHLRRDARERPWTDPPSAAAAALHLALVDAATCVRAEVSPTFTPIEQSFAKLKR
jgi:hypothetical protein